MITLYGTPGRGPATGELMLLLAEMPYRIEGVNRSGFLFCHKT